MTVKKDVMKLSENEKKELMDFSEKLMEKYDDIHTLLIMRPEVEYIDTYALADFELVAFTRGKKGQAPFNPGMGYEGQERSLGEIEALGMHYDHFNMITADLAELVDDEDDDDDDDYDVLSNIKEAYGITFEINEDTYCDDSEKYQVSHELRSDYLNLLHNHLSLFEKEGSPSLTLINSAEMKAENDKFSTLYLSMQFEKGYALYNDQLKPILTLPLTDEELTAADFNF